MNALHIDPIPSDEAIATYYATISDGSFFQSQMYRAPHARDRWQRIKRLLNLPLHFTPRVLDVGCADGMMAEWIAPQVDRYVGIDISPHCVERCRALDLPNAEFHCGTLEQLDDILWPDFPEFDLAIAGEIIEHQRDPEAFMEELRRCSNAILASVPVNELPNPDAFSVDAYYKPRKIGDGSGHIWSFREDTFKALFTEVWHYESNSVSAIAMGR